MEENGYGFYTGTWSMKQLSEPQKSPVAYKFTNLKSDDLESETNDGWSYNMLLI